ncbi:MULTISPECIES: hypothetical protein [unclassified Nocardioides]|uniref:hypothetical protein n=1 Tax=unclassified Nocardioides TaxID=2615069 RepID=UPI00301445D5
MRMHRILAALLGLALLGLMPTSLSAPASAAGVAPAVASAPAVARAAKLPRELHDRSARRGDRWFIKGRVTPQGGRKVVVIKRKVGPHKAWRTWKKVRADRQGRFRVEVAFPDSTRSTWFYKGGVKATAKYQAGRTDKIYTVCRRSSC